MEKEKKKSIFSVIGNEFAEIGSTFKNGDWKTKLSFLIFGFAPIMRGQFLIGFFYLALEVIFILYFFLFGWNYLSKFGTLGTGARSFNPDGTVNLGDNSFLILLYSVLTIAFFILIIFIWRLNIRECMREDRRIKAGKPLPSNKTTWNNLFDKNFDKTLLTLPTFGVIMFTVVPIIFMICVGFTNYDFDHQPPRSLFTWVGFNNFKNLLSFGEGGMGYTFMTVLKWTIVRAILSTFLNYFLGMAVAIMINKKGIKLKKLWRSILVVTIAVPQFISLLYISKLFAVDGVINSALKQMGLITRSIDFWKTEYLAKFLIIIINLWVGIPYSMLITSGLLMNIPSDLYESAQIDGATAWQQFWKITLPYMLFVTGPYLLTSFMGNLHNFNIIYLLNQGFPRSTALEGGAGYCDLLITWLYTMTFSKTDYKMASVLGIMVFLVTAGIALIVYGVLPSVRDEEGFQL